MGFSFVQLGEEVFGYFRDLVVVVVFRICISNFEILRLGFRFFVQELWAKVEHSVPEFVFRFW